MSLPLSFLLSLSLSSLLAVALPAIWSRPTPQAARQTIGVWIGVLLLGSAALWLGLNPRIGGQPLVQLPGGLVPLLLPLSLPWLAWWWLRQQAITSSTARSILLALAFLAGALLSFPWLTRGPDTLLLLGAGLLGSLLLAAGSERACQARPLWTLVHWTGLTATAAVLLSTLAATAHAQALLLLLLPLAAAAVGGLWRGPLLFAQPGTMLIPSLILGLLLSNAAARYVPGSHEASWQTLALRGAPLLLLSSPWLFLLGQRLAGWRLAPVLWLAPLLLALAAAIIAYSSMTDPTPSAAPAWDYGAL